MASALATGRLPGRPRQTGQVCVLGGSPKLSVQPQNILVTVASWTWISRPMTVSYSVAAPLVVISVLIVYALPRVASKPIACSSACAASRIRFSLNAGPAIWKPTGRSSLSPLGIEIAGRPASEIGTVNRSSRYIDSGSSPLAPSSQATDGEVGVTTRSTVPNASL